ncbi:DNA-binding PucR family transcriptional regulator [Rhodococcus sp. 27YEA15]|uniref:PucR family transcriptional regulator n=1 Tax=Rhodococcus sp. 27YEA15 TaxID=3156259 RepID=UPI003C7A165B
MNSLFVDWSDEDDLTARRIAERVLPQRDEFIEALFEATVAGIPELAAQSDALDSLHASIAENTIVLIDALSNGLDPSTAPPPVGAVDYARDLARDEISLASLLRAYRIGQAKFTALCLDTANAMTAMDDLTALRTMVAKIAAFIDHICEEVTLTYEHERERSISSRNGLTQRRIAQLLDGTEIEAQEASSALGYPMDGMHLAVETWYRGADTHPVDIAESAHRITSTVLGHRPSLTMPTGERSVCTWVSTSDPFPALVERFRSVVLAESTAVSVVIGLPGAGLDGFRRAHRQVIRLKALAHSAVPPAPQFIAFTDIAPVAMLDDDPDALGQFVGRVLGPLSVDTVRNAELRETLRNYLAHHRSPAAAAESMILHRNTIRYRIQQIIDDFGHPIENIDSYALTSALEICRWYGSAVLSPAKTTS